MYRFQFGNTSSGDKAYLEKETDPKLKSCIYLMMWGKTSKITAPCTDTKVTMNKNIIVSWRFVPFFLRLTTGRLWVQHAACPQRVPRNITDDECHTPSGRWSA